MTKLTEKDLASAKFPEPKVWHSLNARFRPKNYKVIDEPSMTVPNQSMSVREIMDRHTRGIPGLGNDPQSALYDENSMGIDIRKMDLAEVEQLMHHTEDVIRDRKRKLNEFDKQRKSEARQKDLEDLIAEAKNQAQNEPEKIEKKH